MYLWNLSTCGFVLAAYAADVVLPIPSRSHTCAMSSPEMFVALSDRTAFGQLWVATQSLSSALAIVAASMFSIGTAMGHLVNVHIPVRMYL